MPLEGFQGGSPLPLLPLPLPSQSPCPNHHKQASHQPRHKAGASSPSEEFNRVVHGSIYGHANGTGHHTEKLEHGLVGNGMHPAAHANHHTKMKTELLHCLPTFST